MNDSSSATILGKFAGGLQPRSHQINIGRLDAVSV